MATNNSPGKYSRPSDPNAAYQAQLAKQESARQAQVAASKEKAAKQKLEQQLTDAKTQEARLLALKTTKEKQIAGPQKMVADMQAAALSPSSPGGSTITSAEQLAINQYGGLYLAPLLTEKNVLDKQYQDAVAARKSIEKQLGIGQQQQEQKKKLKEKISSKQTTKKTNTDKGIGGAGGVTGFGGFNPPIAYIYNAPMISSSYLKTDGPQAGTKVYSSDKIVDDAQSKMLYRPVGSPSPLITNGEIAWRTENYTSKGIIQMNSTFVSNVLSGSSSGTTYDDQLYGFRFLYNPKEVAMTWGIAEGVNWEAVQTGLDKSSPIFTGLLNSTVSFSLLLNRMGDMQYLDENGLIPTVTNPYPDFALGKGKTLNKELAEIYRRGTMYDIEYLFKTTMGVNATYKSKLNGDTADKGWLQGTPVDLHLGDGLRYQVRIGSLDVSHTIFNDRMVPILSTINITCHRFYDLAPYTTKDPTK